MTSIVRYLCYNKKTFEVKMRADRLLSVLMLLQSRGRVTAEKLAGELEVSVRTVYRDIEALSATGVPVYTERGPGGGCVLVEGYRTSLTGLTQNEIKALFMMSVPESLDRLGVSEELRTALRKLAAALPENQRADDEVLHRRIYLDWQDWAKQDKPAPHLPAIHRAVREDNKLRITYTELVAGGVVEKFTRLVDPYGLAAKGGEWYLVCADNCLRVYGVSGIIQADITGESFTRPAGFDLAVFWKEWCAEQEKEREPYPVKVRLSPYLAGLMLIHFDTRFRDAVNKAGPPGADGWVTTVLSYDSFWEARKNILNMGNAVEVLEPEPLRLSVMDFARQIVDFYADRGGQKNPNNR
jgi:predicted DNA-binding transcriptional regulator YafY